MTPKQLRSAAHALRTAANALEDVTTQLRTLSTEIDAPDDKNGPEPEPAAPVWPTAKHMWWDGEVWTRTSIPDGIYETPDLAVWRRSSLDPQSVARRFAREAVPVKLFNALTGAEVGE